MVQTQPQPAQTVQPASQPVAQPMAVQPAGTVMNQGGTVTTDPTAGMPAADGSVQPVTAAQPVVAPVVQLAPENIFEYLDFITNIWA